LLDRPAATLRRRPLLEGTVLAAGGFVALGDGGLAGLLRGWGCCVRFYSRCEAPRRHVRHCPHSSVGSFQVRLGPAIHSLRAASSRCMSSGTLVQATLEF
jgi:hypothetical protein